MRNIVRIPSLTRYSSQSADGGRKRSPRPVPSEFPEANAYYDLGVANGAAVVRRSIERRTIGLPLKPTSGRLSQQPSDRRFEAMRDGLLYKGPALKLALLNRNTKNGLR